MSPLFFEPFVNEVFVVTPPLGTPFELTLFHIDKDIDDEVQCSFTLIFKGIGNLPYHQSCRVQHARLGEFELFLGPARWKRGLPCYAAVYNLLKEPVPEAFPTSAQSQTI
jgi:hypothetical protein